MIIVTGANGQLGRQIVERLKTRVSPSEIGVSVRDPDNARDLGVRVRAGSFTDRASLDHAFEGATTILIVSSNTIAGDTIDQHRTAIEAAGAAGATRIVYTSHMGSSATSHFPPMRNHAATEALLVASGVPFTSLRNGFYASSAQWLVGDARTTGQIIAPADGPVSWTTHADFAEAAAIALAEPGRLDGITPPLTGAEALDLAAIAERIGVARTVIADDAYRAQLAAQGAPEARIAISLGMFAASRAGEFAAVDPTLAQLLGRSPQRAF